MGMKPYLKCVCIYTQYKGWDFLYVYQLREFFHQLMQEIYIYTILVPLGPIASVSENVQFY